ncbi:MAG: hypothetical protein JW767_02380 [Thermoleophilia bacterium]|nr:hypothetical protein [Thermoleophilia bacterium]
MSAWVSPGRGTSSGRGEGGLTLVEVLVAAVLACGLAAAAYTWLWGACDVCTGETRAADAQTRLAAVHRRLALDMAQALSLTRPVDGLSEGRFALRLIDAAGVLREVEYCWDPARQVLWRSSSSSYVADGVRGFTVAYLDDRGTPIDPATLGVGSDGRVSGAAALAVSASAAAAASSPGPSSAAAEWVFPLPPPRL